VSTLNLCLKATGLLANAPDEVDDDPDAWMDRLTDEEWAEYETLGDEDEQAEAVPASSDDIASAEPSPVLEDVATPASAESSPVTLPVPEPVVAAVPAQSAEILFVGHAALAPSGAAETRAASNPSSFPKMESLAGSGRPAPDAFPLHLSPPYRRDTARRGLPLATAGRPA
jgi:hypothetical protein